MLNKRIGKQTVTYTSKPFILSTATIVGPKEGEGALGKDFDFIMEDNLHNQESWEKAESFMMDYAINKAIEKANLSKEKVDFIIAGDLLNQLMSTHFAVRSLQRPLIGLYGACSTFVKGLAIASMIIDGNFANYISVAVSSHHDTAERQYRFPTEQGVQRPPISQWTVTGSGSVALGKIGSGPRITIGTIGKIIDLGIKDPNNMGAAMAPAAADTILCHLEDTGRGADYYDMIYTGDLGKLGKQMTIELVRQHGYDISNNYEDCGCLIYTDDQDSHSGASGCASSSIVFCSHIYKLLQVKKLNKILIVGTGSLHSSVSYQQKESIPCIAHAVAIENEEG